jgi:hypothetical protein
MLASSMLPTPVDATVAITRPAPRMRLATASNSAPTMIPLIEMDDMMAPLAAISCEDQHPVDW